LGIEHSRRFVLLKEAGNDARLKTVKVFDVHDDSVLVQIDEFKEHNKLFTSDKGQLRMCDYVLLTRVRNQEMILFIEMKSETVKIKEIEQKFNGALCIMD
ncbi:MAG: hypothetical protein HQK92_14860, partial [Nitrospirae bacterium]|nr:hypothetical protein [Nitrospirota bacterium]